MGFLSDFLSGRKKKFVTSPLNGKVMYIASGIVQIENVVITNVDSTEVYLGQVVKKNQIIGYRNK